MIWCLLPEGDGKEQQALELGDDAAFAKRLPLSQRGRRPKESCSSPMWANDRAKRQEVQRWRSCKALIYLNAQNPQPHMSDIFFEEKKGRGALYLL